MQRSPYRFLALRNAGAVLAAALSAGLLPSAARAAELGDVAVRSYLGQQLSADIELVMLTPEDQAGVQVRLAGPNIYQGANVRMHPALSSLRLSVVKRDNRQFLHLTTLQPVDAEVVHLYLELGTGNRASVRSATLWLTPDPAPVRPAAPEAAAGANANAAGANASAAGAEAGTGLLAGPAAGPSAAERAAQEAQAAANRTAAIRAARMRAAANAARDTANERTTSAAVAAPAAPVTPVTPAAARAAASAASAPAASAPAAAEVNPGPPAVPIRLGPEPRVAKSKTGPAKAAVCAPGQADGEAQQCVALDQANAELKTKLVDLEGKVKQLQAALGQGAGASAPATAPDSHAAASASAAGIPAASAAASAPEAANKAGTVIPPSAPPKANGKKKKEPGGLNTTALVAGSVVLLALLGGLGAYLIRRKKITFSTAPLKVWQGWRKDKKPAGPEAAIAEEAIPDKE
ncbi:hypothetical protein ASC94_24260 [Massilia sp. Root418]|uniref:type IV pilus assembly protein FimV n=1 Tax=Massilia sp. Root418 TaxID=1736532 RepID=UPI00070064DF|nr:hypothetical protein [Massilia sp. Root418]KQW88529.1 hypothetical protein ASC94_24260 [Massilia sp. Root418]